MCPRILLTLVLIVPLGTPSYSTTYHKTSQKVPRNVCADEIDQLVEEFTDWRLQTSPEYGTKFGNHKYDDKLSEWNEEAFVSLKNEAASMLERARGISLENLDKQRKISLRVLEANLEAFVDGFAYRKMSMYNMLAPAEEPTSFLLGLIGYGMKYETEEDFRKAISRLKYVKEQLNDRIVLLNKAIKEGVTLHNESLTGLVDKLNRQIVTNPKSSPFYQVVFNRSAPANMSSVEWTELKLEGERVIQDYVIPAWTKFRNFIRDVYSKNTRGKVGVGSLPNGLEFYKACLKWHLSVDLTPDEIHHIGLQEVERIVKLMQREMEKDGFHGTLQEFIAKLKSDPENVYQTEEEMLDGYSQIIEESHNKLHKVFLKLPRARCKVEKNEDPHAPEGIYSSPNKARSYGVFTANVFNPQNKPKSDMPALTLHEAEPGHHTQVAYAMEENMPVFRREIEYMNYGAVPFNWPFFTAYTEGWALYAESLGEQMGAYTWKYSLFGRYVSEIFRSTRLVVDTGIHAFGWSKERAMNYIANYTTFSEGSIENEVMRYISWPGQACSYKIGELKIQDLKRKAQQELAELFDIREFHDQVLQLGNAPLDALEDFIDDWIETKKSSGSQAQMVIEEFWNWRLEESPEYGTKFGIHDHDDKIAEWTESAFVRQIGVAEQLLQKSRSIARDGLDDQQMLSLQILEANLEIFIGGFPYRKYSMYNMLSPLEAPTAVWTTHIGRMKFNNENDYKKAFSRLKELPTYVDQRIELLNTTVAAGLTLHAASLVSLDTKFDAEIVSNPGESTLFKKMFDRNKSENITQMQWESLKSEAKIIIRNKVVPAWQKFRNYIVNEYSKHTRPEEGVSSLPGGLDYYKACLKWHLTVDMTPEEVHQKGLDEVERIHGVMLKLMNDNNFSGSLLDYIAFLKSQPENYFKTEEEVLQGYKDIISDSEHKLPSMLLRIPISKISVESNPNPQGSSGFYLDPPLDGSRNGTFLANVHDPQNKAKFDMVALALHEAEPGHHTQAAYSIEADIPYFRRAIEYFNYGGVPFNWPFYTAYSEGWALYAELLGEEMDAYKWPHSLFGRYTSEIFRSARLVVDTGIHAFGWSKETAINYVANYTTYSRTFIENEINRYISWPGQACAYKIGQLKISELRDMATEKLGDSFDKREFHDEILKLGNAPLNILEEQIQKWVHGKTCKPAKEKEGTCSGMQHSGSVLFISVVYVVIKITLF